MAEHGKLIKAEDGFYNGKLTEIPLKNKSYSPAEASDGLEAAGLCDVVALREKTP